jgi:hypothetical protein
LLGLVVFQVKDRGDKASQRWRGGDGIKDHRRLFKLMGIRRE